MLTIMLKTKQKIMLTFLKMILLLREKNSSKKHNPINIWFACSARTGCRFVIENLKRFDCELSDILVVDKVRAIFLN